MRARIDMAIASKGIDERTTSDGRMRPACCSSGMNTAGGGASPGARPRTSATTPTIVLDQPNSSSCGTMIVRPTGSSAEKYLDAKVALTTHTADRGAFASSNCASESRSANVKLRPRMNGMLRAEKYPALTTEISVFQRSCGSAGGV